MTKVIEYNFRTQSVVKNIKKFFIPFMAWSESVKRKVNNDGNEKRTNISITICRNYKN